MAAIGPDTITKFLFTSGSTKLPKAVINTHRMWCANQQQMRQSMPAMARASRRCWWTGCPGTTPSAATTTSAWCSYNGGTLYIDDGKPTPALMGETLRNLREIAPTRVFQRADRLRGHRQRHGERRRSCAATLLSRVRMFFYAGAALAQPMWDSLHQTQEAEVGERIVMGTGLGMTESGPFAIFVTSPHVSSGDLGLPTAGMETQAGRRRGQDRGALPWPQHHAWLLARR